MKSKCEKCGREILTVPDANKDKPPYVLDAAIDGMIVFETGKDSVAYAPGTKIYATHKPICEIIVGGKNG